MTGKPKMRRKGWLPLENKRRVLSSNCKNKKKTKKIKKQYGNGSVTVWMNYMVPISKSKQQFFLSSFYFHFTISAHNFFLHCNPKSELNCSSSLIFHGGFFLSSTGFQLGTLWLLQSTSQFRFQVDSIQSLTARISFFRSYFYFRVGFLVLVDNGEAWI